MTLLAVKTVTKNEEDNRGEEDVCTANGCSNFSGSKEWMNGNFGTMAETQNQICTQIFPLWLPATNEFNWSEVK